MCRWNLSKKKLLSFFPERCSFFLVMGDLELGTTEDCFCLLKGHSVTATSGLPHFAERWLCFGELTARHARRSRPSEYFSRNNFPPSSVPYWEPLLGHVVHTGETSCCSCR